MTCTCRMGSRSPCTPTLTRVWSRAGRPGQRLVQAPGTNFKQYGFGLVDWRDGILEIWSGQFRVHVRVAAKMTKRAVRLPGALSTVVCVRAAGDRLSRGQRRPAWARSR